VLISVSRSAIYGRMYIDCVGAYKGDREKKSHTAQYSEPVMTNQNQIVRSRSNSVKNYVRQKYFSDVIDSQMTAGR
jgi:hypothetical protein